MPPKGKKTSILKVNFQEFLKCDLTEKNSEWSRFCVLFHTVKLVMIDLTNFFVVLHIQINSTVGHHDFMIRWLQKCGSQNFFWLNILVSVKVGLNWRLRSTFYPTEPIQRSHNCQVYLGLDRYLSTRNGLENFKT